MSNKDKFGEVLSPKSLVENIYNDVKLCFGENFFVKHQYILEPGCGQGAFYDFFVNDKKAFHDDFVYIINEINPEYEECLTKLSEPWKDHTIISMGNILDLYLDKKQDLILGNLPFNVNTKKFVPGLAKNNGTNKEVTCSKSATIWNRITKHCFEHLLENDGHYLCVIPCIWLKPDRCGIYELFTQIYTMKMLKTYSCTEANKLFSYNCQTPVCYVLVQKRMKMDDCHLSFKLYNKRQNNYESFSLLEHGLCIPTDFQFVLYRSYLYMKKHNLKSCASIMKKISLLKPSLLEGEHVTIYSKGGLENHVVGGDEWGNGDVSGGNHKIITGALFNKKTNKLTLNGFVSHNHALYGNVCKLILPHKRLARFFKDPHGEYSCYGRDMFVFLCDTEDDVNKLFDFFNIGIVRNLIENGFTIRMNFIEKYIFDYLPNVLEENMDIQEYLDFIGEA